MIQYPCPEFEAMPWPTARLEVSSRKMLEENMIARRAIPLFQYVRNESILPL